MAASTTQNPPVKTESKSAKKKKAKAATVESGTVSAPAVAEISTPSAKADSNNGDTAYESPYIKELYK